MSHKRNRRAQVSQQQYEPEAEGGVATAVQDTARRVAAAAEQAWDGASQGVQYAAEAPAPTAEAAWDGLRDFLRRYPISTFCAGAAIGVLAVPALERLSSQSRR